MLLMEVAAYEGYYGRRNTNDLAVVHRITRINLCRRCFGKPPTSPWGSFEAPNDWLLKEYA
jgi:hypothetical protein